MDTNNNIEIRKRVDRLIEEGRIDEAAAILNDVVSCEPELSVDQFIRSVKEDKTMKNKISKRVMIAVAAVCAVTCVSVGAATLFKQFTFNENGKFVSVTSNSDISREEAAELAKNAANDNTVPNESNTPESQKFKTIAEAEKAYDMKIALPKSAPKLDLETVEGNIFYIDENTSSSTVWATYGDTDKKAYGLTVTKKDYGDKAVTDTLVTDSEPTGEKFVSDMGYSFDVLNETDEETGRVASIYMTYVGNYEYAVYFTNFDTAEIKDVVNSIDLGEYK